MRKIVYDVAISLDGFICHEDGSVDGFLPGGPHADDYLERLKDYDTVLMGRKTYEFGYEYGLKPGDRAYEHMEHFIFSNTLSLQSTDVHVVSRGRIELVREIKASEGNPIYLCGGGTLAGWLLEHDLVDELVIKLNPVLFGAGVKLFADVARDVTLDAMDTKEYENGVSLRRYSVRQL